MTVTGIKPEEVVGMGMILARMPWNQCRNDSTSCCAR